VEEVRVLRRVVWRWLAGLAASSAVVLVPSGAGLSRAEAQGVRNPLQVDLAAGVDCADAVSWTVFLTATNHDSYPARIAGSLTHDGQTQDFAFGPNPLPPGASGRAELAVPPFGPGSWKATAVPEGPGVPANQGGQGASGPLNLEGCVPPPPAQPSSPVYSGPSPWLLVVAGGVAVLAAAAAALAVLQRRDRSDPERDGDPPG
jgi:hypothetical protein